MREEVGTMLFVLVTVEAEGPSGGEDAVVELLIAIELLVSKTVVGVVTGCLPVLLGSPRFQATRGVASTGAGGTGGGTTAAASPRGL